MSLFIKIIDVHAREILDSRGNPTVEVEVTAETETTGKRSRRASLFRLAQAPGALRRLSFGMEKNGILGWVSGK